MSKDQSGFKKYWKEFDPRDREGAGYCFYDDDLVSKINIALAAKRPLLLTGRSGIGKSQVAKAICDVKAPGSEPIRTTITSLSSAENLQFSFDPLARLYAVQTDDPLGQDARNFVRPGPLWWAFNPSDARDFLLKHGKREDTDAPMAGTFRVLLIDEIDKGNLDLANDLLNVFDDDRTKLPLQLPGGATHAVEKDAASVAVVITSNGERALPEAFERRCILHRLEAPDLKHARRILKAAKPKISDFTTEQIEAVAEALTAGLGHFNTARFLHTMEAAEELAKTSTVERAAAAKLIAQLLGERLSRDDTLG